MDMLIELAQLQAKLQQEKLDLTKKHEEAFKDLELRFQSERTILANAAEAELQARLAAEEREVQRALEATNDRRKRRNSCPTTSASSVCELHEKKIEGLQEEVLNIKEDLDNQTDLVNALNTKHTSINDELQEAKKAAVALLKKYTSDDTEKRISVKRAGELSTEAWAGAFQERFFYSSKNGPESQRHMTQVMSELDTTLRSSAFHPFMKIQVAGKDEWEEVIDPTDPQLVSLCEEYGEEVCESVTDALKETMIYNLSGRYIVEVPWNYITNKEATMKDIVQQLGEMINKLSNSINAPARKRRNYTPRRKTPA